MMKFKMYVDGQETGMIIIANSLEEAINIYHKQMLKQFTYISKTRIRGVLTW